MLPPVILLLAIDIVVQEFPRGLIVLVGVTIAFAAAWYGLIRTGAARVLGVAIAVIALAPAVIELITNGDHIVQALVIVAGLAVTLAATRAAFSVHIPLADVRPPGHPVLFFNPKSGGGKAEKFNLAEEARARDIQPIELTLGTDLEQLVRAAVADGADGLAMAGGDGSQAIVATIAAELDLPYALHPGRHPQPFRPRPGRRSR